MTTSVFSVQTVISLILRGTLAISVVIIIRIFRSFIELLGLSEI
jgi:hypothetical protein